MSTSYQSVYDVFLGKITDIDLVNLPTTVAESTMHGYLISAVAKFTHCKQDLTNRDDTTKQFNIVLTDLETEILATSMTGSWTDPYIKNIMLMKQSLSSKDFTSFSQANHLKELQDLKTHITEEVSTLLGLYSYIDIKNTFGS